MMQTLDDLRDLMKERGLEKLLPYAERLSSPAIRLLLTEVTCEFYPRYPCDKTPIGCSKIGGLPDLPLDFIWPEFDGIALPFIAQLRLEDVRQHDINADLPSSGILFIFYDDYPHMADNDARYSCHVHYYVGETTGLQRRFYPENIRRLELPKRPDSPDGFDMPFEGPFTIQFQRELNVADDDCVEFYELAEELKLTEKERSELWWQLSLDWSETNARQAYREVLNRELDSLGQPFHQLLGLPYCGNYDGRDEILRYEEEAESHDWRQLFQLSSHDVVGWGDGGIISFFISKEALKNRDFSDVRVSYDG